MDTNMFFTPDVLIVETFGIEAESLMKPCTSHCRQGGGGYEEGRKIKVGMLGARKCQE